MCSIVFLCLSYICSTEHREIHQAMSTLFKITVFLNRLIWVHSRIAVGTILFEITNQIANLIGVLHSLKVMHIITFKATNTFNR